MSTGEADDVNVGMRRRRCGDVNVRTICGRQRICRRRPICGRRQPGMSDVGRHSVFALFISSKLRDQGQSTSILRRDGDYQNCHLPDQYHHGIFAINIMMAGIESKCKL